MKKFAVPWLVFAGWVLLFGTNPSVQGADCAYTLSPTNRTHGYGATNNSIVLFTSSACGWQIVNTNSWILITSATNGVGATSITYTIQSNPGESMRTGLVQIAEQTFVLTQKGTVCTNKLSARTRQHGYGGAISSVDVSNTCGNLPWTVVNTNDWITILSDTNGLGSGTVLYTIGADLGYTRTGVLLIADQTFTVTQQGTLCTYSLVSSNAQHGGNRQTTGTVSVATTGYYSCGWTVVNTNSWITFPNGNYRVDSGSAYYAVAVNPSATPRTGVLTVNDMVFTVTQAGNTCSYFISTEAPLFPASGAFGALDLITQSDCAWTVVNTNSWLSLLFSPTGVGSWVIQYLVAANSNSAPRSGVLVVGDQLYTVKQEGAPCTYTVSPSSASYRPQATNGLIYITTGGTNCSWAVANTNSWITVTSAANGAGSATVRYTVLANPDSLARSGNLFIAGQPVTINQMGVPCTYTIDPMATNFSGAAATGTVALTTPNGCAWTVMNTNAWITLLSADHGIGNGVVAYSLRTNLGLARTGYVFLAAMCLKITQGQCLLPVITNQPVGASVVPGGTVTLTAAASGSAPLRYQWCWNGAAIAGATNTLLLLTNLQTSQSGSYTLVVANDFGSTVSAGAVVSVQIGTGGGVNFCNSILTETGMVRYPVFDVDGVTKLDGSGYLVQLYAGPAAELLAPTGPAAPFKSGNAAGLFNGGSCYISSVAPGDIATVQVRAWDSAFGPSYEAARSAGGRIGESLIFQIRTARQEPPEPPPYLLALQSFSLHPAQPAPPPQITLLPQSQAVLLGANTTLTVTAEGLSPLTYQWQRNGTDLPGANGSSLNIVAASLANAGDYRVIVRNPGGAVTSQVATVTVAIARELTLGLLQDVQPGGLVSVPVVLTSAGDVGGMSFLIRYDADYLSMPELLWGPVLDGALKEANAGTPGQVQAVWALPAAAVPAGTQTLATLSFRARLVPTNTVSALDVEVLDVSQPSGTPLLFGTAAQGASVRVAGASTIPGDNNANGRLDAGDATLLLRMLAGLDSVRPWDLAGNDLNQNVQLDSGDAIKILRVACGIDATGSLSKTTMTSRSKAMPKLAQAVSQPVGRAVLSPAQLQGKAGDLVTVQLRLEDVGTRIAAATVIVQYPVEALRLAGTQSHRIGSLVPPDALVMWNLGAEPNTGMASFTLVVSSTDAWPANEGVLAELTFQVQSTASAQYLWPVTVLGAELFADGYASLSPVASNLQFIGRAPLPPSLGTARVTKDGLELVLTGETGATYQVEVSTDMITWTPLTSGVNDTGTMLLLDSAASSAPCRFYRARMTQPR